MELLIELRRIEIRGLDGIFGIDRLLIELRRIEIRAKNAESRKQ